MIPSKFTQELNKITMKRTQFVNEAEKTRQVDKPGVTVKKYKGVFDPQKIYQFRYNNPITRPHKWDARPLAFILGIHREKTGNQLLAVNLHWIPLKDRTAFWNYLKATLSFVRARKIEHLYPALVYTDMKNASGETEILKVGLVAIRKYLVKNIRYIREVPVEHYDKIFVKYQPRVIQRALPPKSRPNWDSDMQSKINIM